MDDGKIKIAIKKRIRPVIKPQTQTQTQTLLAQSWASHEVPAGHTNVIISFDIGIINLAYCIMQIPCPDSEPEVFDWGIIRLADGDPKKTCSRKMKNGTVCTRKAFYTDSNIKTRNNGVCKMHKTTDDDGLERNVTVENATEWELKSMLFAELDSDTKYLNVNSILIENQPLKAREKIKGIGHALFDYYVLRGSVDNGRVYDELKFIDAKNKLTVYTGPALSCHLKTQYARNKWYSVRYCQWIIRNQVTLLNYFDSVHKKDDLADCFLQGLWYLKYGQTGTKAPMTSSHQKLVYRENNRLQYKKIRARPPNKKSITSKHYTLSNVKWFMTKGRDVNDAELKTSIEFFFGDIDYFYGVLKNT